MEWLLQTSSLPAALWGPPLHCRAEARAAMAAPWPEGRGWVPSWSCCVAKPGLLWVEREVPSRFLNTGTAILIFGNKHPLKHGPEGS